MKINLRKDPNFVLINILNEVCHGFTVKNFDERIGATPQYVVTFLYRLNREYNDGEISELSPRAICLFCAAMG
jgi:hypothetical protein